MERLQTFTSALAVIFFTFAGSLILAGIGQWFVVDIARPDLYTEQGRQMFVLYSGALGALVVGGLFLYFCGKLARAMSRKMIESGNRGNVPHFLRLGRRVVFVQFYTVLMAVELLFSGHASIYGSADIVGVYGNLSDHNTVRVMIAVGLLFAIFVVERARAGYKYSTGTVLAIACLHIGIATMIAHTAEAISNADGETLKTIAMIAAAILVGSFALFYDRQILAVKEPSGQGMPQQKPKFNRPKWTYLSWWQSIRKKQPEPVETPEVMRSAAAVDPE